MNNNKNFNCMWEISKYKFKQFKLLNKKLESIFNINNYNDDLNNLNLYFDFNGENYNDNIEAFKILILQKDEILAFLETEHTKQQEMTQRLSRRKNFEQFYQDKNIFNIIKVKVSKEWLEQQELCYFNKATKELINNKINFEKLLKWAKANIDFAKQQMQEKLNTTDGFLGANLSFNKNTPKMIIFSIPLLEKFSKALKNNYYCISHNQQFGNKYDLVELQDNYIKYMNTIKFSNISSSIKNKYLIEQLKMKKIDNLKKQQIKMLKEQSMIKIDEQQILNINKTLDLEDIKK